MRLILDGVFNHSGDSHAWFDRHNPLMGGACHNPDSPQRDWYSFNEDGRALDWLGYPSLPKLDFQSPSLVNEIYGGEHSIVRHWLNAPWNMDGWRLDVVHMLGKAVGRVTTFSMSPGSPVPRKLHSRRRLSLASILVMRVSGCRPMRKMRR
jgi:alpha-glucosidase